MEQSQLLNLIIGNSLKKDNLEVLKNIFEKCSLCRRDAIYKNKDKLFCWNHSL